MQIYCGGSGGRVFQWFLSVALDDGQPSSHLNHFTSRKTVSSTHQDGRLCAPELVWTQYYRWHKSAHVASNPHCSVIQPIAYAK